MYTVIIKHLHGESDRTIHSTGEHVELKAGENVVCRTSSIALSSLTKEGDELYLSLGEAFNISLTNFFELPDTSIEFDDRTFTQPEILEMLSLHIYVKHLEGAERHLDVLPGSRIQVHEGDQFEFLNSEVTADDLHRKVNDLRVLFHLEETGLINYLDLGDFFDARLGEKHPPNVILADEKHHATDMFVPPHRHESQIHGTPNTMAIAGMLYAFHFMLKNYARETSDVEVLYDGAPLPSWLSLTYLGGGKFVLSGIPPVTHEGSAAIEINVTNKEAGLNVHTQEAYHLTVLAKPDLTERAAVVGVLEAEVRGGVATQSSESFMSSSQAAASSVAPLAILAAVSTLTVFGQSYKGSLNQVTFSVDDIQGFMKEMFDLDLTNFVLKGVESTIAPHLGQSHYYEGGELTEEKLALEEKIDGKEPETRKESQDVDAIEFGDEFDEFGLDILFDDTSANSQGDFFANPDTIQVSESTLFNEPAPGILGNDTNEQTSAIEVFSVGGNPGDVGNPFVLPSGGIVTVNSDGTVTFDPNGAYEFLAEGQTIEETFTYLANNFFDPSGSFSTVTIVINGENDAPVTFNQSFSIEENSSTFTPQVFILASDVDQGDVLSYTIIAGSELPLGLTAFAVDSSTAEITIFDVSLLDFETNPTFTFDVQVSDILLATANTTITINLIDVNEAPEVEDQTFSVDENTIDGTVIGRIVAADQDVGDFNILDYTMITPFTSAFSIDMNNGDIIVNDMNQLNFEQTQQFMFGVEVADGEPMTDDAVIKIDINDVAEAPDINNQSFSVNENAVNGTSVGTVLATDQDAGDSIASYGIDSTAFSIDSNGQIIVADMLQLDFETMSQFQFDVTATDTTGLMSTATVTVDLNDISDVTPEVDLNGTQNGINFTNTFEGADINVARTGGNGATVVDVENDISLMTITITNVLDGVDEGLTFVGSGGITGSYDDSMGRLTLNGTGSTTSGDWEDVLQSVEYFNDAGSPETIDRIIEVAAFDDTSSSVLATSTIEFDLSPFPFPFPLEAAAGENTADVTAASLTYEDLNAVVDTAYSQWVDLGLSTEQLTTLNGLNFEIDDLSGGILGLNQTDTILIDQNAANWGWNVDVNAENFYGQMDLLTVVNHEIGHALGVEHSDEGLMSEELETGVQIALDDTLLDYEQVAQDDGEQQNVIEDIGVEDVLANDEIAFEDVTDTQTSYADDLMPNAADSLQTDGMSGADTQLSYDSLSVDSEESVI